MEEVIEGLKADVEYWVQAYDKLARETEMLEKLLDRAQTHAEDLLIENLRLRNTSAEKT